MLIIDIGLLLDIILLDTIDIGHVSNMTDIPPALFYGDLDEFEILDKQWKEQSTSSLTPSKLHSILI